MRLERDLARSGDAPPHLLWGEQIGATHPGQLARPRLDRDPVPVPALLARVMEERRLRERRPEARLLGRAGDVRRLHALLAGSRVVSIVGPGGLGKTRLAHVLGREYPAPVVHFVELVGVTAPDDLVGEVGSVLGVRDSVSGRRALTPEQRADVRARIARYLDQSPGLLILDNCEHIVAAVADLDTNRADRGRRGRNA